MANFTLHTATLNGATVLTDEYTLTKATGTTFKFDTNSKYSDKNIILNVKVKSGGGKANSSNVTCITNNIANTISSTGVTSQPSSGYYIGMVGSGSSTISTAGWMNTGALSASSTTKYFTITPAVMGGQANDLQVTTTVATGNVTMNTHNVMPTGKTSLSTLKPVTTTASISKYFIPIIATAAANTTGATTAITGTHTASITTAGFAPTTLQHITDLTGVAAAKTSAKNSGNQYIPIPTAVVQMTGNKNATSPTETLVTANNSNAVNVGANSTITTTAPTSGFFVATKPTAPATTNITLSASSFTAGYTGSSTEITGAASTNETTGSTYYVPLNTASPTFIGGALGSKTATATGTNTTFSDTDTSGISIQAHGGATREVIKYQENISGWLKKNANETAYAAGSNTTWDGTTYYLTEVKLTNNHAFNITVPNGPNNWITFHFSVDNNGNTTVT